MANCDYCGKDMLTAEGCVCIPVVHNGKKYEPIKVGEEGDWMSDPDFAERNGGRCPDCGAKKGHYHHPGCDNERCPVCGRQLISCDCQDEEK